MDEKYNKRDDWDLVRAMRRLYTGFQYQNALGLPIAFMVEVRILLRQHLNNNVTYQLTMSKKLDPIREKRKHLNALFYRIDALGMLSEVDGTTSIAVEGTV